MAKWTEDYQVVQEKEPIIVQLDELIQSSPEIQASIKVMIEENNKTIY